MQRILFIFILISLLLPNNASSFDCSRIFNAIKKIISPSDVIESANKCPKKFTKVRKLNNLSPQQRFEVILVLARETPIELSKIIGQINLTQVQRIQVAEVLMSTKPYVMADCISDLKIPEKTRHRLILKSANRIIETRIFVFFRNLIAFNLSEEAMIEVIKLRATKYLNASEIKEFMQELPKIGIKSSQKRTDLILYCINAYSKDYMEAYYEIANGLPALSLTMEQRYKIADALLNHAKENTITYISESHIIIFLNYQHQFNLNDLYLNKLYESFVTKPASFQNLDCETFARYLRSFKITSTSKQFEFAKEYVRAEPTDLYRVGSVDYYFNFSKAQIEQLQRIPFSEDPVSFLNETILAYDEKIGATTSIVKLKSILHKLSDQRPYLLPKEWIDILWDKVKKRNAGYGILRLLYENHDYILPAEHPSDSIAVIARGMGINEKALRESRMSNDTLGELYEIVLDIESTAGHRPFAGIEIEDNVFSKKQVRGFIDLCVHARDLFHARGNTYDAWRLIINTLFTQSHGKIEITNLVTLNNIVKQEVVEEFRKIFGETKKSFTYEQLKKLEKKWGDFEPIITLASRYSGGNYEWKREIPILAKIFKASLEGRFQEYKFTGDRENPEDIELAANQLAVLRNDPAKIEAWIKPRRKIGIFSSNGTATISDAQRIKEAKLVIETNLIPHLKTTEKASEKELTRTIEIVKAKNGNLNDILDEILNELYKDQDKTESTVKLINGLAEKLKDMTNIDEMRIVVRSINAWSKKNIPQNQDVLSALSDIKEKLQDTRLASGDTIVFTTTFDHPKMTIMIGNLVHASSCLNYKTGGYIQTLPGDVIDANVRGIISFGLNVSDFSNQQEFTRLFSAIRERKKIEIDFDEAKRIANFKIQGEGAPIVTIPLTYGFRRHKIKLGATDDFSLGVALEKQYIQLHLAQPIMIEQVKAIQKEIAQEIGGVYDKPIKVAKTRNPSGVYSDQAGGIQTTDYTMTPFELP